MWSFGPRRNLQTRHGRDRLPGISVVVPVFNEEENVGPLYQELQTALDPLDLPYELIFVDDESRDGSPDLLREMADEDERVRVIHLQQNRGQSAAMAIGFRVCRRAVVVTLDADLQNDPADIPRLLKAMEGYDVVCGIRAKRQDTTWRRVASKFANAVRRRVTGDPTTDTGCTLKAFKAEVVEKLLIFRGMHRFLPALARMEGYRITEIPVNHRHRIAGVSKYGTFDRLKQTIPDVLAVRWLTSRYLDFKAEEYHP